LVEEVLRGDLRSGIARGRRGRAVSSLALLRNSWYDGSCLSTFISTLRVFVEHVLTHVRDRHDAPRRPIHRPARYPCVIAQQIRL
jgi:hypothetical protein